MISHSRSSPCILVLLLPIFPNSYSNQGSLHTGQSYHRLAYSTSSPTASAGAYLPGSHTLFNMSAKAVLCSVFVKCLLAQNWTWGDPTKVSDNLHGKLSPTQFSLTLDVWQQSTDNKPKLLFPKCQLSSIYIYVSRPQWDYAPAKTHRAIMAFRC